MRYLVGFVLFLSALGTLRVAGCGDESPCGDCSDGDPCTEDRCTYDTGGGFSCDPPEPEPEDYYCDHRRKDDGAPCGSGDVCVRGVCRENLCQGVSCDDGNPCTRGVCDYDDGKCDFNDLDLAPCQFDGVSGICIGSVCGEDICTGVECNDDNPCTEDHCSYRRGCVYEPVRCDDENQCTVDKCNPLTGRCDFTTPVEDGEGCWAHFPDWNKGICEAGVCVPPCDPASEVVTPCPYETFSLPRFCCPGSEFCADRCRWTCPDENYGAADGCHCGCGIIDPDCADGTVGSCDYCGEPGSCNSPYGCPGCIDPAQNWICAC